LQVASSLRSVSNPSPCLRLFLLSLQEGGDGKMMDFLLELGKCIMTGAGAIFTLAKGLKEVVSLIDMCVELKRKLANRKSDDESK
jgi:hypothetical protein